MCLCIIMGGGVYKKMATLLTWKTFDFEKSFSRKITSVAFAF